MDLLSKMQCFFLVATLASFNARASASSSSLLLPASSSVTNVTSGSSDILGLALAVMSPSPTMSAVMSPSPTMSAGMLLSPSTPAGIPPSPTMSVALPPSPTMSVGMSPSATMLVEIPPSPTTPVGIPPSPTMSIAMPPSPTTPAGIPLSLTTAAGMPPLQTTSASTTPTQSTQIPSDAKQFKGQLTMTDTFDEKLKDKTSPEFKKKSDQVKKELEEVYKEKTGLIMVVIDGFKRGSTVVEFRVIFQSNAAVTEDEVVKTINDAVIDGKLGGLTIKEGSIQVSQIGGPTTEAPTTEMDEMQRNVFILMLVGVIVAGLVLLLLIVVVCLLAKLWRSRKTRIA